MKLTIKLLALFFGVLMLVNVANADSPRGQFKQMVEQLQQSPNDNALREKIIKLAQIIKPAPAVPEEAERRMARGTAAFKGAKSVADYRDAVKEFEQATLAAPWYGDAYFNLGVAQDKAEDYEAALSSLKLALLASPNGKEIKALIYEVEYRNDKVNSAVAAVEQEKKAKKEFIEKLDGAQWQIDEINDYYCDDSHLEIHHGEIYMGLIVTRKLTRKMVDCTELGLGKGWYVSQAKVDGRDFVIVQGDRSLSGTISEDGEKIVTKYPKSPTAPGYPGENIETYHRVKNPKWTIMSK